MVVFLPLVVSSVVGILFLWMGLRTRRRGLSPHCAGCDYNVTGLTSDRCPECGGDAGPATILLGERYRRPWVAALGAGLLALAVLYGASLLPTGANWYQYRPTFLVLLDARASTPTAARAWAELKSRATAGSLSAGQRAKLAALCLKEQAAATAGPHLRDALTCLNTLWLKNQLSAGDQQTFYRQMVRLSLVTRAEVIYGEEIPYQIRHECRGPDPVPATAAPFWVSIENKGVRIDGKQVDRGGGSQQTGCTGSGNLGSRVPCPTPGAHTLRVATRWSIRRGAGFVPAGAPLYQADVEFDAPFRVVEKPASEAVKLIQDASAREKFAGVIRAYDFSIGKYAPGEIGGTIAIEGPPLPACFRVLVRGGGGEYDRGCVAGRPGGSMHSCVSGKCTGPSFDVCDVILRSDPAGARETVDLVEIWSGEIVLKDVPVTLGYFAASQPASAPTSPG